MSPAQAEQIRIVAFGSSSTYGQGVGRNETYPVKLEQALRAKGHDVSVANAGISGDTTPRELARLDSSIPAGTHIAILEMGINDQNAGIDPATTKVNVATAAGRLRARGVQVLVLGYRNSGGALQAVAAAKGASYMDFNFPNSNDPKYRVASDPQIASRGYGHFNAAGYDAIVARMVPHVVALIGKVGKKR